MTNTAHTARRVVAATLYVRDGHDEPWIPQMTYADSPEAVRAMRRYQAAGARRSNLRIVRQWSAR